MKIIISIILMISYSHAQLSKSKAKAKSPGTRNAASTRKPQSIETHVKKCQNEFLRETAGLDSQDKWIEQAPAESGGKAFRTPTNNFGKWIDVSINPSGLPTLFVVQAARTIRLEFSSSCQVSLSSTEGLDFSKLNPDSLASWFDDKSLEKLLGSGKSGLIYVWSPEMVYSAKFFKWFRDTAKQMNLEFIPLIDPRTKITLVDSMSNEYALPSSKTKLNSVELYMRGMTTHYPMSLVFKNGKLSDLPIVGVMSKEELEENIRNRLNIIF